MSNGAEGVIDDFREGKKKETPPEAKKYSLVLSKVGDIYEVSIEDIHVKGRVLSVKDDYSKDGAVNTVTIELEEIS